MTKLSDDLLTRCSISQRHIKRQVVKRGGSPSSLKTSDLLLLQVEPRLIAQSQSPNGFLNFSSPERRRATANPTTYKKKLKTWRLRQQQ